MILRGRRCLHRAVSALLALCIGFASVQTLWAEPVLQDHGVPIVSLAGGITASLIIADTAPAGDGCVGLCLCTCHCSHAQVGVTSTVTSPPEVASAALRAYPAIYDAPTSVAPELHLRPPLV